MAKHAAATTILWTAGLSALALAGTAAAQDPGTGAATATAGRPVWWVLGVLAAAIALFVIYQVIARIRAIRARGLARQGVTYRPDELKIFHATDKISTAILFFVVAGAAAVAALAAGVADSLLGFAAYFGLDLLVAAAAGSIGALFGFIFGIPRTGVDAALAEEDVAATRQAVLSANTNLERVSDWLTTLLIGATLVQLGNIPGWLARMSAFLEGGVVNAKAVPFIAVYFFGLGFLGVYLISRLYLTSALAQTLGLLAGGAAGVPVIQALRTMLKNAWETSSDPDVLASALGIFDRWPLTETDRADPALNAEHARLLAKYLQTGKADNAARRTEQLKRALPDAAADPTLKQELRTGITSGDISTGDQALDDELRQALN